MNTNKLMIQHGIFGHEITMNADWIRVATSHGDVEYVDIYSTEHHPEYASALKMLRVLLYETEGNFVDYRGGQVAPTN